MYVAITRARERLYLSFSQTRLLHGQTRYNLRSRFFEELPEGALKWITPRQSGFGSGWNTGRAAAPGRFGIEAGNFPTAAAPLPPRKAEPAHGLKAGMKVFHNKFGEGTVKLLEGSGDDARAQIDFPRHGVKWLALSVAKLQPVS